MRSLRARHGAHDLICAQNFTRIYSTGLELLTRRSLLPQIDSYLELLSPKVDISIIEIWNFFCYFLSFSKLSWSKTSSFLIYIEKFVQTNMFWHILDLFEQKNFFQIFDIFGDFWNVHFFEPIFRPEGVEMAIFRENTSER